MYPPQQIRNYEYLFAELYSLYRSLCRRLHIPKYPVLPASYYFLTQMARAEDLQ